MRLLKSIAAFAALLGMGIMTATTADAADLENTIYLDLKDGRVVIKLRTDLAPNHVARIKELTRAEFYDGTVFHRVITGFMAQTGDPTGTGSGGSDMPDIAAEFSDVKHVRGTVSMARSRSPNSANSQFFIVYEDSSWLDNQYTIWGQVTSGMEYVDNIRQGHPRTGSVDVPDQVISMKVAADVK